ncbi:DUF871 domain-containing protein [Lactococcus garvieae]|uniref:DUF871 domain-containing protein n=1 Tax=Lactococcus garvieae TaxID=1363 RepID=UPI00254C2BF9|nr:DUF871 domain-containing protein [Lactococcus garvieae]
MGKIGISIYPEKSTFEKDKAYLDLAHKYGFKRVFTSLLEINGDKETVIKGFKKVVEYASSLEMEVMVDISPRLFETLSISYDDLSFFNELCADGIRLDLGFTGHEEAKMTRNPYGLKIEINMSSGTNYVDNIMSYSPKKENLIASHNFYPMEFSGLSLEHFESCNTRFNKYGLNTAAFVSSQTADFGPWPIMDGLCSLENHRNLPLVTQVKHLILMGTIDDIIIGNAYASEEELKAMSQVFFSPVLELVVEAEEDITEDECINLFDFSHFYRGDRSEYLLRSTMTRVVFKDKKFPAHNTVPIKKGAVLVGNENFGQYKGETQIALKNMPNDKKRVNVIGHVVKEELILLDYMSPWTSFKMIKKGKL